MQFLVFQQFRNFGWNFFSTNGLKRYKCVNNCETQPPNTTRTPEIIGITIVSPLNLYSVFPRIGINQFKSSLRLHFLNIEGGTKHYLHAVTATKMAHLVPPVLPRSFFSVLKNKSEMARVGVTEMAQNTHWTELILMFQKMYFGIIFGIECQKT